MTNTYLTGNALGSTAPKDLYDNASNFDELLNSPSPSFEDRFKKRRETWAGMQAEFADFLQASANVYIGEYAAGVTFTRRNQYMVRDGIAYRPDITTPMPLVLTGTWATDQPKLVAFNSDALLRTDLASSDPAKGAHLIKWKGNFLDELLPTWPEQFGAIGDGVADDRIAVQAWLNAARSGTTLSGKPGSTYRVVDGFDISVEGTILRNTHFIYPQTSAGYYHCARIAANNCKFLNNVIESPAGLSRGNTGFGVLISNCDNVEVSGNRIDQVASAAIWITSATKFVVSKNRVFFPAADGIHVTDGCRDGIVVGNHISGCHDDSLAVVGDTPAAAPPLNIIVANNVVDGSVSGHGVVLIACDTVIVIGNILRATALAGIGSYFWNLSGVPVAKDWANNCLVSDNIIIAPSQAAINVNNVAGIFAGAAKGWELRNNVVYSANIESLTSACALRLIACQDFLIEANHFRDSPSYGIWNPDSNTNGAEFLTGLVVRNNYFSNIQKEAIRLSNANNQGVISLLGNDFYQCAYSGAASYVVVVAKTGSSLLSIIGNTNIDGAKDIYFDPATCSNVYTADNSPDMLQTYAPNPGPLSGGWTSATSSGSFYRKGGTVFFRAIVTVSNKGSGAGLKLSLPATLKSGGFGQFTGRENTLTGKMVAGFAISTIQLQINTYDNGDPISANGASVEIDGWFTAARS